MCLSITVVISAAHLLSFSRIIMIFLSQNDLDMVMLAKKQLMFQKWTEALIAIRAGHLLRWVKFQSYVKLM